MSGFEVPTVAQHVTAPWRSVGRLDGSTSASAVVRKASEAVMCGQRRVGAAVCRRHERSLSDRRARGGHTSTRGGYMTAVARRRVI